MVVPTIGRILLWTINSVLILLIATVMIVVAHNHWAHSGKIFELEKFDRDIWIKQHNTRYDPFTCSELSRMVSDLKTRILKQGMTMSEVEYLLGISHHGQRTATEGNKIGIYLGPCTSWEDVLVIDFDDNERLKFVRIVSGE